MVMLRTRAKDQSIVKDSGVWTDDMTHESRRHDAASAGQVTPVKNLVPPGPEPLSRISQHNLNPRISRHILRIGKSAQDSAYPGISWGAPMNYEGPCHQSPDPDYSAST